MQHEPHFSNENRIKPRNVKYTQKYKNIYKKITLKNLISVALKSNISIVLPPITLDEV